jgi:hypothetical protein
VVLACKLAHMFRLHIEERPVVSRSADPMERNPLEAAIEDIQHCIAALT